jgi:hypothetical protein
MESVDQVGMTCQGKIGTRVEAVEAVVVEVVVEVVAEGVAVVGEEAGEGLGNVVGMTGGAATADGAAETMSPMELKSAGHLSSSRKHLWGPSFCTEQRLF